MKKIIALAGALTMALLCQLAAAAAPADPAVTDLTHDPEARRTAILAEIETLREELAAARGETVTREEAEAAPGLFHGDTGDLAPLSPAEDMAALLEEKRGDCEALLTALGAEAPAEEEMRFLPGSDDVAFYDYTIEFGGGRAYLVDETGEIYIPLFTDGDGTSSTPFVISTAADLFQLAYVVNDLKYTMSGCYFVQDEDIDLNCSASNPWVPIGSYSGGSPQSVFCGYYFGYGHTVSGIYSKVNSSTANGLFGAAGGAWLQEIDIADSTFIGGFTSGALVGIAADTDIIGCTVQSSVSASVSADDAFLGGVVGMHSSSSYNTYLYYCSAAPSLTAYNDSILIGGIAAATSGYSYSDPMAVIGCRFTGKISGAYCAGGIVGMAMDSQIMVCYNTGTLKGDYISSGIAAVLDGGDIFSAYNTGTVTADNASGIAGLAKYAGIMSCYNTGTLSGGSSSRAIVFSETGSSFAYCYYTVGSDYSYCGTKLTKSELKSRNYLDGFNFTTIWGFRSGENSGYPVLLLYYPALISGSYSYHEDHPGDVYIYFEHHTNLFLSIPEIPARYYMDASDLLNMEGVTAVAINQAYFQHSVPTGTYAFTAQFGAGCDVPFRISVVNCTHPFGDSDRLLPTCTQPGYYRVYCTSCERLLYEDIYAAKGHDVAETFTADIPATCTEDGYESRHCSRCDYTEDGRTVARLGHDLTEHEAQAPTCAQVGWNAYIACSRGDYTTYEEIPALPHVTVSHEGKEVTHLEPGWAPYETCENCTYSTFAEILPVHPESIAVSADSTNFYAGGTYLFSAAVSPEDTTLKDVVWTSSNENVLQIQPDGSAVAVGSGTAVITATAADDVAGTVAGSMSVKVSRAITHIDITGSNVVAVKKSVTLKADTYCYENGVKTTAKGSVIWTSSDETVATVSKGKVTGKTAGEVIITATAADTGISTDFAMTVVAPITSLKIASSSAAVYLGYTLDLGGKLTVSPADHTDTLLWASSNDEVATVDENGLVTPVAAGKAKITATATGGGKKVTCTVTVSEIPDGIVITGASAVATGKSTTLKAYAYRLDEDGNAVKTKDVISWSSNDEAVATVSKGKVTGKTAGSTEIVAYIEGTDVSEVFSVSVVVPVKTLKFSATKATLYEGREMELGELLSISPAENTDTVEWSSSNEAVATVDENGHVTAISLGTAKITAKAVAGNKKVTFSLTVAREPQGIVITGSSALAVGKSTTLKAYAFYIDDKGKTVKTKDAITWSSSDESVATVSAKGSVSGKAAGEIIITASVAGTELSETFAVNVIIPVKSLKFSPTKATVQVGESIDLYALLCISPEEHTDVLTWSSSRESVATVDEDGVVTAVASGSAKITVQAEGSGKKATFSLTVKT